MLLLDQSQLDCVGCYSRTWGRWQSDERRASFCSNDIETWQAEPRSYPLVSVMMIASVDGIATAGRIG